MPKAEKVKKSKKEKNIHPNSRKASQLNRAQHKSEKKEQRKVGRQEKEGYLWEKVLWFRDQLVAGKDRYSVVEVSELISRYINRFDDRLNEIKQINTINKEHGRHGRAHAAEEDGIKMVHERELNMFVAGQFEAPDITNRANVKAMRELSGDWKELPRIKLRKFKQQDAIEMETEVMEDDDGEIATNENTSSKENEVDGTVEDDEEEVKTGGDESTSEKHDSETTDSSEIEKE